MMMTFENIQALLAQWFACAETFLHIPAPLKEELTSCWHANPPVSLYEWGQTFRGDLLQSRNGYPLVPVHTIPYTEIHIEKLLRETGVLADCERRVQPPALCLSHDIDYLASTLQMTLKRLISQRRLKLYPHGTHFLDSLERLLVLDQQAAGDQTGVSTLFIPCPSRSRNPLRWPTQWLIDPSYKTTEPLFERLKDLVSRFHCVVGLHGGFFSLSERLVAQEKKRLESAFGHPVALVRQHWLNLPTADSLERLSEAGFVIDSTLGWNGAVGFRCGMARPFPILLEQGRVLWEVPLVLMDGPLFDDLQLSEKAVVEQSQRILQTVLERGGCVSINWHERAAFSDYAWDGAYAQLLEWAAHAGFRFQSMDKVISTEKEAQPCNP